MPPGSGSFLRCAELLPRIFICPAHHMTAKQHRLLLATAATILGLAGAEVACRVAGKPPLCVEPERLRFWAYDPTLGWRHRPGQSGEFITALFRTHVTINSKGLRDRNYSYQRTPEKQRILVLGDSMAWGFGVRQTEAFSERLELHLQNTEVINAAVSGYSTDQELLWLENEGLKYRPDVVLVLVTGNDIPMNAEALVYDRYYKPYFRMTDDGKLTLCNTPVPRLSLPMTILYHARRRSALINQLYLFVRHLPRRTVDPAPHPSAPDRGFSPEERHARTLTIRLLERMRTLCNTIDAKLLVVTTSEFWGRHQGDYDSLVDQLVRENFAVMDVNSLEGYSPTDHVIQGEVHWNKEGHDFVARCLQRELVRHMRQDAGGRPKEP